MDLNERQSSWVQPSPIDTTCAAYQKWQMALLSGNDMNNLQARAYYDSVNMIQHGLIPDDSERLRHENLRMSKALAAMYAPAPPPAPLVAKRKAWLEYLPLAVGRWLARGRTL
jgi:hypothetical protein